MTNDKARGKKNGRTLFSSLQTCPYSSGNGEKRNLLNKNGDGGLLTDGPTALQKKNNCGDDDGDGDADPPTVVCQILKGL